MIVKELIERLQFLIKEKYLSEEDLVLLLGTGNVKSDFIQSICMPKVEMKYIPFEKNQGYCHLGFCSNNVQSRYQAPEEKSPASKFPTLEEVKKEIITTEYSSEADIIEATYKTIQDIGKFY